jgi:ankyrin repeat protein
MYKIQCLSKIFFACLLCLFAAGLTFADEGQDERPDIESLIRQGEEATESLRALEDMMEGEGAKMDLRIALVEAVKADDLAALRAAEAKGADLAYVQGETGETILMVASYYGALECVKYLIRVGLDPRAKTRLGDTSVHSACMLDRPHVGPKYAALRKKKAELIRFYISSGYGKPADLAWNVVWNVVWNLGHLAASMDNCEALEALKASGVDIDAPMGPLQIRPLALVAGDGRLETVKTLVKLGARVSAETGYGMTALDEAINKDNEPVVKYLTSIGAKRGTFAALVEEATEEAKREEREEREAMGSQEGLPLVQACWDGDLALVKQLVSGGMDPNLVVMGTTPLIASINVNASPELARFLLSKGAAPNLAVDSGQTALITACMIPSPAFVKILLAAGANPNLSMGGLTPLEFAKMAESPEVESLLRKAGAKR